MDSQILLRKFRRMATHERDLVFSAPLNGGAEAATFVRASAATFLNNDTGLIATAVVNEARYITYSGKAGLLHEGAATNLIEYSEDFSNAYWTKVSGNTTIGGSTTMPDGTTGTTNGFIGDANDVDHGVALGLKTLDDDVSYTLSVYAKKGNKDWVLLQVRTKANNFKNTYFDINNGVVGATAAADDKGIEDVGNGWYRCWVTQDIENGATAPLHRIYSANANNDSDFVGDASTVNTYFWGAQLEETPYPTSYIPTGGYTEVDDETGVSEYRIIGKDGEAAIGFGSLFTQPEDFSDAFWTKLDGGDVTGGSTTMPDGSTGTVNGIIADTTDGVHGYKHTFTDLLDDTEYTVSVYAKAGDYDWLAIFVKQKDDTNAIQYFDLANGAEGTPSGLEDSGIEDVGNGWYRCWATFDSTSGAVDPYVYFATANSDGDRTQAGDESTVNTYFWGAMLTEGTAPVPYLPYYDDGNSRIVLTDSAGASIWAWIGEADAAEALGSELITDGGIENWTGDDPDDWSDLISPTIENEQVIVNPGGSVNSLKLTCDTAYDGEKSSVFVNVTGRLYKSVMYVYGDGVNSILLRGHDGNTYVYFPGVGTGDSYVPPASWTKHTMYHTCVLQAQPNRGLQIISNNVAAGVHYLDDCSIKQVTAIGLSAVHVYDNRYNQGTDQQNWIGDTANFLWNDVATMEIEQANSATQTSRATEDSYPRWTTPAEVVAAIGDGGEGTLICECIFFYTDSDGGSNTGLFTSENEATSLLTTVPATPNIRTMDGTSSPGIDPDFRYGDSVRFGVHWGSNAKFSIGYSKNGGSWTWVAEDDYDGVYTSDGLLCVGVGGEEPFTIRNIKIYDVKYSTARIEQMSGG